jgi:hypothetical protein
MFSQPQLRMKILCPNCKKAVNLSELEAHGYQTEKCGKCGVLVYATYELRDGGRKIWDIHYEKPPDPKKKEPKRRDGCGAMLFLIFIVIAVVASFNACGDLKIIINGP